MVYGLVVQAGFDHGACKKGGDMIAELVIVFVEGDY
jgi:hypothetical protein